MVNENGVTSDLSCDLSILLSALYLRPPGALKVILHFKMCLSHSTATEKSVDATYADHVPRSKANLFSSVITFDSLCHSRCAPSMRDSTRVRCQSYFSPEVSSPEFEFSNALWLYPLSNHVISELWDSRNEKRAYYYYLGYGIYFASFLSLINVFMSCAFVIKL